MTLMTTMDRHREEGELLRSMGEVCEHGNARGYSNYDVAFCGKCERERENEYMEEMAERENAEIRATAGYPRAIGPDRNDFDLRVRLGFEDRPVANETGEEVPF